MKSIWRIIRFTGSLWRYYLGVSVFSILVAAMTPLVSLLTKAAIDQISHGVSSGHTDVTRVAVYAVFIFVVDFSQTVFSDIGGYIGDMLSAKQQRLLSNRYYEH